MPYNTVDDSYKANVVIFTGMLFVSIQYVLDIFRTMLRYRVTWNSFTYTYTDLITDAQFFRVFNFIKYTDNVYFFHYVNRRVMFYARIMYVFALV